MVMLCKTMERNEIELYAKVAINRITPKIVSF